MTVLARLLVVLVATAGALVMTAGPAAASCAEPSADLLDTSDLAFSGAVSDRRESGGDIITTVRVDRAYQGEVTKRVDVVSPADEVDLSMTAGVGERLIVFGELDGTEVTSTLCRSVTGPGQVYKQVLTDLGQGTAPSAGYMKAERRTLGLSYDQFRTGRAIFGALALTAMAYFLIRSWRARRRTT